MTHGIGSPPVVWEAGSINLTDAPKLSPDELHIWATPLATTGERSNLLEADVAYLPWLTDREMDKFDRMPADKKGDYLRARVFLRKLLAAYTDTQAGDIELGIGRLGKPQLIGTQGGPAFNYSDTRYSDTRGMGIYVIGDSGELGIDIENLARKLEYQRILQRKFSAAEITEISSHSDKCSDSHSQQSTAQRFLAGWTRKESYGKAMGVGVNFNMNEVEIACDLGTASLEFEAGGRSWWLTQLLFDEYVVGLTASYFPKLRFFRL
ncbi:MAG: 4'-phosphopantetheinyl transferase superfamily protein [Proteobacteria bacterium]|jgi:phosphopantetheinyl transferase|nr:4'-phosphopantetheinyl transferase superfamily protein [Pseudomonadota bacterium]